MMILDVKQMSADIPTSLENHKNKPVQLIMKEERTVRGILLDFDVHMNLTLENAEDVSNSKSQKLGKILVRGDNIFAISIPKD
jgi:small nuclear ribonucleoprotein